MHNNYFLRLSRFFIILAFIFSAWKASANSVNKTYSLYYFSAAVHNNTVEMEWKTSADMPYTSFVIQYSLEGLTFDTLAVLFPSADDSAAYHYVHFTPSEGMNYYRLILVDLNGGLHFSPISGIMFEKKKPTKSFDLVQVYPMPAEDELSVSINCSKTIKLRVLVLGESGKTVINETINCSEGTETYQLDCSALVSANFYTLLLIDESGSREFRHILKR